MKRTLIFICLASVTTLAHAASLSDYMQFKHFSISESEASGIAFSRDTGFLYVIGDEGRLVREYTLTGQSTSRNQGLGGFGDTEGLAYLGNGRFMIADERIQKGYRFDFNEDEYAVRDQSPMFDFTTPDNACGCFNTGLEGLAYDHLTGSVWGVKEKGDQRVFTMTNVNGGGPSLLSEPFNPASLGLMDLADIYMLSASAAFAGTDREWNVLLLSQESRKLVEVTRTGELVGSLDLSFLQDGSIEGVTMDDAGTLYLVSENTKASGSNLYAITPVPEPSTMLICIFGAGMIAFRRVRPGF